MTARRPAQVITLIDSLAAGGAERVAVEVACALDRNRFAPRVLVTRGGGPLRDLLDAADVPYELLDRSGRLDLAPWRRAHALVREADLLHAHKFGSNVWGSLLARTARVPMVVHEHNFSAVASRSRRLLDRHVVAPVASRVLCVSESVAAVERASGVPDRLIEVVPNGVRLDAALSRDAARHELGLGQGDSIVGIVGVLRPEKAHEVLLEACALLKAVGSPARVCIVGDGPRMEALRAQAADLGIGDRIIWAGARRDAARLASAFDVGVVCSDWEGLPLAALEAMAASVPVVATAVGGLVDLVGRDAGILVPTRDSGALAEAITRLVEQPDHARSLGRTGRRRVFDTYSFDHMLERIQTVYDSILRPPARQAVRMEHAAPRRTGRRQRTGPEAA